jgi:hypothetical protein
MRRWVLLGFGLALACHVLQPAARELVQSEMAGIHGGAKAPISRSLCETIPSMNCTDIQMNPVCSGTSPATCTGKCWVCSTAGVTYKVCYQTGVQGDVCNPNAFATPCGTESYTSCWWGGLPAACRCPAPPPAPGWTFSGPCSRSDCM